MAITKTQFLATYERLLRQYCPALIWPNPFLHDVAESVVGKPPHYEMQGSRIAQAAWESVGGQGDVTTDKLRSLL